MGKLLTFSMIGASALLAGCSTVNQVTNVIPESLSEWSIVHKRTIQQGNVLTAEGLENLQPGMSKDEVRIALGTPSLVDVFHQDRWDYIYWLAIPREEPQQKTLSIYFVDELVDRIEGDYEVDEAAEARDQRVIVEVPDYKEKSAISRSLEKIGIGSSDD